MNELQKVESQEHYSLDYFNKEFNLMDSQIDKLEGLLESDNDRLGSLEKEIFLSQQKEKENEDELLEAIYVATEKQTLPDSVQKLINQPQAEQVTATSGDEALSDTQVQQIKDLLNEEKTMDYIMYSTAVVALVVGIMIGGACLMCVMNCVKKGQEKRLVAARQWAAANQETTVENTDTAMHVR